MHNKTYREIIQLISIYEEFKQQQPEGDVANFGLWLSEQHIPTMLEEEPLSLLQESPPKDPASLTNYYQKGEKEVQITILLLRMYRYAKAYLKRNYEDQQLDISLEEFGFLAGAEYMKNATKTALINANLQEITTGTEIIKRLIKLNYLEETLNPNDKRSKYINLSEKGKQKMEQMREKMTKIAHITCAQMTEIQKDELLQMLIYLNEFHLENFFQHKEHSIEELSLKIQK
ncbi:MAG: hypothetical protein EAZ55_02675 [Cytophagales bacterium]|nr:MAG: hypothetical protein EAZ55_02675 [Cytophagales bacterium]